MGTGASSEEQDNWLGQNYQFVRNETNRIFGPNTRVYSTKEEQPRFFASIQQNFSEEDDYRKQLAKAERHSQMDHDSLVKLVKSKTSTRQEFCSHYWTIQLLFEYVGNSLEKDIQLRKSSGNLDYDECEVYHIIVSVVAGLASMESNRHYHADICPQNILINPEGKVMLLPQTTIVTQHNLMFFLGVSEYNCYLSPLQLQAMREGKKNVEHNVAKSDLFSLGVVALEAALLVDVQDVYDLVNKQVNELKIEAYLRRVAEKYSEQLADYIRLLLTIDEDKRPDSEYFFQKIEDIYGQGTDIANKLYSSDEASRQVPQRTTENAADSPHQKLQIQQSPQRARESTRVNLANSEGQAPQNKNSSDLLPPISHIPSSQLPSYQLNNSNNNNNNNNSIIKEEERKTQNYASEKQPIRAYENEPIRQYEEIQRPLTHASPSRQSQPYRNNYSINSNVAHNDNYAVESLQNATNYGLLRKSQNAQNYAPLTQQSPPNISTAPYKPSVQTSTAGVIDVDALLLTSKYNREVALKNTSTQQQNSGSILQSQRFQTQNQVNYVSQPYTSTNFVTSQPSNAIQVAGGNATTTTTTTYQQVLVQRPLLQQQPATTQYFQQQPTIVSGVRQSFSPAQAATVLKSQNIQLPQYQPVVPVQGTVPQQLTISQRNLGYTVQYQPQ